RMRPTMDRNLIASGQARHQKRAQCEGNFMTNWKSMGFAAFLIAFSVVDARAECVFSPFEFFPDRNDVVHVAVESNGKGLCDISFREGPGYRYRGRDAHCWAPPAQIRIGPI